jgi:hypothetical protein
MRSMMMLVAAVAVAVGLSAPAGGQSTDHPQVPAPPVVKSATPKCLITQREHKRYAKSVYHRDSISKGARRRLARFRGCASSPRAARNMRREEARQSKLRQARATMYCGTPVCNRNLLRHMAGPAAFSCLDPIISQESGYVLNIHYGGHRGPPGRVAWGIPQALPPQKMASAGRDWATNAATQIRWLLGYVAQRYGGACNALAFKRANGSY